MPPALAAGGQGFQAKAEPLGFSCLCCCGWIGNVASPQKLSLAGRRGFAELEDFPGSRMECLQLAQRMSDVKDSPLLAGQHEEPGVWLNRSCGKCCFPPSWRERWRLCPLPHVPAASIPMHFRWITHPPLACPTRGGNRQGSAGERAEPGAGQCCCSPRGAGHVLHASGCVWSSCECRRCRSSFLSWSEV